MSIKHLIAGENPPAPLKKKYLDLDQRLHSIVLDYKSASQLITCVDVATTLIYRINLVVDNITDILKVMFS